MSDRYSRNEGLFGAAGQKRIADSHVAIVGLGGLGCHLAQQLAYLGVSQFGLVDFDIVTDSSLNRLVGAIDADVGAKTKKVNVAKRLIKAINPDAVVRIVDGRVDHPGAALLVSASSIVFGCLDRELPRLQLTEVCSRYAKPYFDLASDTNTEDKDPWYGGRVVFCNGSGCLLCLGLLDQEEMRREAVTPDQAAADDRIYGVEKAELEASGPSVISINATVASLAVTEFIAHVTGLRPPIPHLVYRADQQTLRRCLDRPEPGCYYCTSLWGVDAGTPRRDCT
jgi:molybdopterin-synthase adenylyltransferase